MRMLASRPCLFDEMSCLFHTRSVSHRGDRYEFVTEMRKCGRGIDAYADEQVAAIDRVSGGRKRGADLQDGHAQVRECVADVRTNDGDPALHGESLEIDFCSHRLDVGPQGFVFQGRRRDIVRSERVTDDGRGGLASCSFELRPLAAFDGRAGHGAREEGVSEEIDPHPHEPEPGVLRVGLKVGGVERAGALSAQRLARPVIGVGGRAEHPHRQVESGAETGPCGGEGLRAGARDKPDLPGQERLVVGARSDHRVERIAVEPSWRGSDCRRSTRASNCWIWSA